MQELETIVRTLFGKRGKACVAPDCTEQDISYAEFARAVREYSDTFSMHACCASVLQNGVCSAAAFVVISQCTGYAPFNPKLGVEDISGSLRSLRAEICVLNERTRSFETAFHGMKVELVEICVREQRIQFIFENYPRKLDIIPNVPYDLGSTALILGTSGSTGAPKKIKLSLGNIMSGALWISRSLQLQTTDAVLNIMPLFHIGGLSCNILAPLVSGGVVVCANWTNANTFCRQLLKLNITWYYASPTLHLLICEGIKQANLEPRELSFIRSGAAALSPSLARDLEATFGAEILPTYSMTECMPVAATPRGQPYKATSVGIGQGTEIVISNGNHIDSVGEVLIRGPHACNFDINDVDVCEGWLRTGDQGFMDAERWLHLVGRTKEIIKCGGETVSPFEVENNILAILEDAQEVVAFGVDDARFGEVIGVLIRLRQSARPDIKPILLTLRKHCQHDSRMPSFIYITKDAIPRGHTSKIERLKMHKHILNARVTIESSWSISVGNGSTNSTSVREEILQHIENTAGVKANLEKSLASHGLTSNEHAALRSWLHRQLHLDAVDVLFDETVSLNEALVSLTFTREPSSQPASEVENSDLDKISGLVKIKTKLQERACTTFDLRHRYVPYAYSALLSYPYQIDIERLQCALQSLLSKEPWCWFSGRFESCPDKYILRVDKFGGVPLAFQSWSISAPQTVADFLCCNIDDFTYGSTAGGVAPLGDSQGVELSGRQPQMQFPASVATTRAIKEPLAINVTMCKTSCVIAVTIAHNLADGWSMVQFLKNLSQAYCGTGKTINTDAHFIGHEAINISSSQQSDGLITSMHLFLVKLYIKYIDIVKSRLHFHLLRSRAIFRRVTLDFSESDMLRICRKHGVNRSKYSTTIILIAYILSETRYKYITVVQAQNNRSVLGNGQSVQMYKVDPQHDFSKILNFQFSESMKVASQERPLFHRLFEPVLLINSNEGQPFEIDFGSGPPSVALSYRFWDKSREHVSYNFLVNSCGIACSRTRHAVTISLSNRCIERMIHNKVCNVIL